MSYLLPGSSMPLVLAMKCLTELGVAIHAATGNLIHPETGAHFEVAKCVRTHSLLVRIDRINQHVCENLDRYKVKSSRLPRLIYGAQMPRHAEYSDQDELVNIKSYNCLTNQQMWDNC